jgi:hypothetical protein
MKATTTTVTRYDHNDRCIGCGAHLADPCGPDCPMQTGQITAAVVLRYAAPRLPQYPAGVGYDVRDAIFGAAQDLLDSERPYPLAHDAAQILAEYLHQVVNPGSDLSGPQLIYRHGLFVGVAELACELYAAAAHSDGIDFDPEDFGDLPD